MIPNIFISSTITDLSYLRDSIRDLIIEIGYTPIMSEYGDVGYTPFNSAQDSCYLTVKNSQLAVVIVGKKYGTIAKNELSVTHNEFRTAKENKIPVIFLVDQEMMSYKKVFELNNGQINIPDVENPSNSFALINEFMTSDVNNGIVVFSSTQTAKNSLKKQLAHIFGDLLRNQFDPIKGEIKDILSEISTLKHVLLKNEKEIAANYSKAFRFLLDKKNNDLRDISETISGSLEYAVQDILNSKTFRDYLVSKNVEVLEVESNYFHELFKKGEADYLNIFNNGIKAICHNTIEHAISILGGMTENDLKFEYDDVNQKIVFAYGKNKFWGNSNAFKLIEAIYNKIKI